MDISFSLPDSQTRIEAKVQIVWADLDGRAGATFVVIDPAVYKELQEWTDQRMKEEGWELPLRKFAHAAARMILTIAHVASDDSSGGEQGEHKCRKSPTEEAKRQKSLLKFAAFCCK